MQYVINYEEDHSYDNYVRPNDWSDANEDNQESCIDICDNTNVHLKESGYGYDRRIRLMEFKIGVL